ncbi:autotransporter outer membrane beta-barrel domain-containing protein, partial [Campylobacter pinnipediorum]|uniref:autotransporter outer membrane beta-barrel domain-containing protein n=2 Tax=Campylobacter pinnipediorum TaxID=1965231 RepID=UPI001E63E20C
LLTNKDNMLQNLFTVNFDYRNYSDINKLTWNNNMAGDAGIHKKGTGTLYLGGENTYQGITWIENGAIVVQKSLKNSQVTIEKGGMLLTENHNNTVDIGSGNAYSITNNGGLLKIYGSGLKINGNYVSKDKGRLAIDIEKSKLEVTGSIDMNNNSYIIPDLQNVNSVLPASTTKRNIINAKEIKNYNGDYKTSNNVSNFIDLSKFYIDGNRQNIWVEYSRKATAHVLQAMGYVTASSSNTAKNFDTALEELSQTQEQNEISATAVRVMNAHANVLPQMIDSLSGEIHASNQNIILKQNQTINRTLSNRIASLMRSYKSGVWFDGVYGESKITKEGYANTLAKTKGTQIGLDGKVTDELTLGLAISKSASKATFDKSAGDIKIENDNVSVYGSYDFLNFYLSGRVGLNDSKNDIKRVVADKNSDVSYNHKTYSAYTELGSFYNVDFVNLNPFIATELNKISRGAFSENLPLGITADKKRYNTYSILAGVRSSFKFNSLTLNSNITHSYAPKPNDFSFDAKFSNMNNNINVKGISQAKHITWLGFGLIYDVNENFTVDFKHDVSIQDGKKDNSVFTLGAFYKF